MTHVYAGYDTVTNQHLVAENQSGCGVRIISLNQFLHEGKLVKIEYNQLSLYKQNKVITRIENHMGKAYHWFSYNCEHFVNEVLNGKAFSKQIVIGVLFTIFVGVIIWNATND